MESQASQHVTEVVKLKAKINKTEELHKVELARTSQ